MAGKFKGIIFDLDGVLIDTKNIHRDAFIQAFLQQTGFLIHADWHDRFLCGMTSRDKIAFFIKEGFFIPGDHTNILKAKDDICSSQLAKLVPSTSKKLLMNFIKSKNLKLGCFTNCRRINADQILKQIELYDYFDITVSSDEVSKPKPAPDGYNKIIENWQLKPEEVLIIEDSPHGVEAARKSGAYVHIVKGSYEVNRQNLEILL